MNIISKDQLINIIHNIKEVKYDKGGLWEEEIKIAYDYPIYEADKSNCPHLGPKYIVRNYFINDNYFDRIYANCPRVILAKNKSGCNSTCVCLDCILKNIEKGE